jgi:hypothetical protein
MSMTMPDALALPFHVSSSTYRLISRAGEIITTLNLLTFTKSNYGLKQ